jgi:hypothetical protein
LVRALETFETGPGLEQRAVHREVFVREQAGLSRLAAHGVKKRAGDIAGEQALAILAEGGVRPDRLIHTEADKPSIQHAVVDLFHQQPLAAHRVERLEQQRAQQLLGWNRRPAHVRVHLGKARRQLGEHAVGHRPNGPEWMIGADALFGREVTEHVTGLLVWSTHAIAPFKKKPGAW